MTIKPVAIVLGGTVPHKFLIENLKCRGYRTILVDYYDNPPAASTANLHIKESALDLDKVEAIAREYEADLVITAALDQPLPIAIAVSEKLGLPKPFSLKAAHNLTNKNAMKKVMQQHGIPTPFWLRLDTANHFKQQKLTFPLIVKPEDGTGSRGITILNSSTELQSAFEKAASASNTGFVVIEEFRLGQEVDVDCVVIDGKTKVVLCRERHKCDLFGLPLGIQCVATVSPARLGITEKSKIVRTMSEIATAFGIMNGVMIVQLIIDDSGEISVLELAGRVSGGPGGFVAVKQKTGVDLLDCVVCSYLGEPINYNQYDDGRHYATGSLYCGPGVLASIVGVQELLCGGIIDSYFPYKNPGDALPDGFSTKNRVAGYAVSAVSRGKLKSKLNRLFEVFDVLDSEGKSIFLRQVGAHQCL